MKTIVSTKGRIILPAEFRQRDGVEPGQEFEVERMDRGEYRLKRKAQRRNEGLVKLLLACPVKGWSLPKRDDKAGIRRVRDAAVQFAEENGATVGQVFAVKKALTEAGYHLVK